MNWQFEYCYNETNYTLRRIVYFNVKFLHGFKIYCNIKKVAGITLIEFLKRSHQIICNWFKKLQLIRWNYKLLTVINQVNQIN